MYQPPRYEKTSAQKRRDRRWIIGIVVVAVVLSLIIFATSPQKGAKTSDATSITPTVMRESNNAITATTIATPAPTVHYPPKTIADLHGLAAQGNANAIHEFHSESTGAVGACPQPKRLVTVDPAVKDRQLAEDLLAYFYGQQLDSPCGSIVFAYHNQSEGGDTFTAGRINFDVSDASGATNFDPNATSGLTHKLTLDVGGLGEQEYVVTY